MTISAKRQFLSNMLWRLFAFLTIGGLIAICSCEPVNRKLLPKATRTIACVNDEGAASTCKTSETTDVSPPNRENRPTYPANLSSRSSRQARLQFADNNDVTVQVSGRKKKDKGYGKMLLYLIGAAKAALIYGLLHGVAALAGKAVLLAKIALAIAIAAMLKKHDHGKTNYEIVTHPHHSYLQTHSSSIDYDHRSDYGDHYHDDHQHDKHFHDDNHFHDDHRKRRRIFR